MNDVVVFLEVLPSLFDILEYANIPTLQNSLPVYYTLYEAWQPQLSDSPSVALMKKEFLMALTEKYWSSLNLLHFVATFLDPSLRHFLFVRNTNDRQGFFNQIEDSLLSLAQDSDTEAVAAVVTSTRITEVTEGSVVRSTVQPPVKKMKSSPFDWFQSSNGAPR